MNDLAALAGRTVKPSPVKLDERSSWMDDPVKSSLMNDLAALAGRTAGRTVLRDLPEKLYDEDAGRAGEGANSSASARGR